MVSPMTGAQTPDHQRYPRAIDEPRQFVPPEAVGAEPVLGRERRPALQHVHVGRARQRQQVARAATANTSAIQPIAIQNSGPSRRRPP